MRRRSQLFGTALALAATLGVVYAVAGQGAAGPDTGAPPELSAYASQWPAPGSDAANTRDSHGTIDESNVHDLGVAWTVAIHAASAFGGMSTTPVISDGVVYYQDLESNVTAVSLKTGAVLWRHVFDQVDLGPNGVAVGYGRVYGATQEFAFALNAKTGKLVWRSKKLPRNGNEGIDMQPAVYDGLVYVSTVPGSYGRFYQGDGVGIVWALNAATGAPVWHFDTVPLSLWGNVKVNSGGGLWYQPSFDEAGYMYIGVGNPGPVPGTTKYPFGSSRLGPNLDTDSVVKLNAETGQVIWVRQITPHDLYDQDLQLPPIVTESNGQEVVVVAGKSGIVASVDAASGKVLWKVPVGVHNGHDNDGLKTISGHDWPKLPETIEPGVLGGVETPMAVADGVVYVPVVDVPTTVSSQTKYAPDIAAGKGEMVALDLATGKQLWKTLLPAPTYGGATVSGNLVFTTTFDGTLIGFNRMTGKIVWSQQMTALTNSQIAVAGNTLITAASDAVSPTQRELVIAYRLGAKGKLPAAAPPAKAPTGGTTQGKELFSANCAACHTLASAGASGTVGPDLDTAHPSEKVVYDQVLNGGKVMPSFKGRLSTAQITAIATFVATTANPKAKPPAAAATP